MNEERLPYADLGDYAQAYLDESWGQDLICVATNTALPEPNTFRRELVLLTPQQLLALLEWGRQHREVLEVMAQEQRQAPGIAQDGLAANNRRMRAAIRALCAFLDQDPPEQLEEIGWFYLMPTLQNYCSQVAATIDAALWSSAKKKRKEGTHEQREAPPT